MIYYEHHLGDYLRDTAHLSVLEDGVYRRLIDAYYIRERALPTDLRDCCKLARANSKAEREAVASVLKEFFTLQEDGYHQSRADVEIARFSDKQEKARRSAEARWSAVRSGSERNADGTRTHSEGISERNADGMLSNPQSPDKNPPTPRKRGNGHSRKTEIPDGFTLTPDREAYIRAKIPDADPAALIEAFASKAKAKGWTYVDWDQALQTYVRNCAPGSGHFAAGQYPRRGIAAGGIQWQ